MNRILAGILLAACLSSTSSLSAQEARQGSVKFARIERPAFMADYPYSSEIVASALRARLDRSGFSKPRSEKGFSVYKAAAWPEVSPGQVDVYTRVDGKRSKSTLTLLVSKGYDNYVSTSSDSLISARIFAFLSSMTPDIQTAQLQADILSQEEKIRIAERSFKASEEDSKRLANRKEDLEREIANQAAEKSKRSDALNSEKSRLQELKSKLK